MLVLSRKEQQTIVIDDQITVTVVKCGNGRVRLGITAPSDLRIRRGELPPHNRDKAASGSGRAVFEASQHDPLTWNTHFVPVS